MTFHDPPTPSQGTLLRALALVEREQSLRHDPRWDRLAEGDLPITEREPLRRRARESESGDVLFGAFEPLPAASLDRIARSVTSRIHASRPRRSYGRAVFSAAAVLAVAAVALGVCVGLQRSPPSAVTEQASPETPSKRPPGALSERSPERPQESNSDPAPSLAGARLAFTELPHYTLEMRGGDIPHAVRGAPASGNTEAPLVLGPGASLEITLRPATAVEGPVILVACLARGGHLTTWSVPWDRSEQGAFHVQGTRERLFPGEPSGDVTLLFAPFRANVAPQAAPCESLSATETRTIAVRLQ